MPPAASKLTLALQHIQAGRHDQARALLTRALQQNPSDVDANSLMCYLLTQMGQHTQALFYARRADSLSPSSPSLLNNLANTLLMTGDTDAAIAAYERAHTLDPTHLSSIVGLTNALNTRFRYDESDRLCRQGLALHPGQPRLMAHLAVALLQTGRARESVRVLREAARTNPDDPIIATGLPHTMNYAGDSDPREVLAAHEAYGHMVSRQYPGEHLPPALDKNPDRKLRIGILSGDLRSHAVGFFAEPLLEHLDRAAFEITCYSTTAAEDRTTERLKKHTAAWRNPVNASDPELGAMIRRDKVDILVELSGHTAGHRLPVLYLRAAPIQATYFGYPNTTGVPGCDYRIVDSLTDPQLPEYDALATERLVRLDPCFLCYRPLAGAPDVALPPLLKEGAVTFGSFNSLAKLDDLAIGLYARVLRAVPGSRMLLKYSGLGSASVRDAIAARFAAAGVGPERLILDPPGAGAAAMLAAYARMDVMLDSYPYHGTTTTCEALFMGVPVVSLVGRVCAARVGLSILSAVGLGELAVADEEAYVRAAAGLARDPARLAEVRGGLRERMLGSPVCDGPGFGARFGAALREMWRAHCRG